MSFAHTEDGTRIQYEMHGSGKMTVILLHGWGGSASYWRELVSHLNLEGLQIIAPSYRGHGDSGQPATGYTLDQFAKDMLSVADDAGAERFVLVGFSMSGKFAQYIAAEHPERILGLVLIAAVPASEFPFLLTCKRRGAIPNMIAMRHSSKYSRLLRRFLSGGNSRRRFSMTLRRLLASAWRRR